MMSFWSDFPSVRKAEVYVFGPLDSSVDGKSDVEHFNPTDERDEEPVRMIETTALMRFYETSEAEKLTYIMAMAISLR